VFLFLRSKDAEEMLGKTCLVKDCEKKGCWAKPWTAVLGCANLMVGTSKDNTRLIRQPDFGILCWRSIHLPGTGLGFWLGGNRSNFISNSCVSCRCCCTLSQAAVSRRCFETTELQWEGCFNQLCLLSSSFRLCFCNVLYSVVCIALGSQDGLKPPIWINFMGLTSSVMIATMPDLFAHSCSNQAFVCDRLCKKYLERIGWCPVSLLKGSANCFPPTGYTTLHQV